MRRRPVPSARAGSGQPMGVAVRADLAPSSQVEVATPAGVFAPAHRALSVGILVTITAIACEGMAVTTILPTAAMDLGGLDGYGWAFSAFMLASLVGAISAGQTADQRNVGYPARLGFALFS